MSTRSELASRIAESLGTPDHIEAIDDALCDLHRNGKIDSYDLSYDLNQDDYTAACRLVWDEILPECEYPF